MQTQLLTVRPETPLLDIHRMFAEEEIHGAPVVDEDGHVRGVVSTLDLVRALRDECESPETATAFFRDDRGYTGVAWSAELQARLGEICAADVMTRELVTVTPDTPVADVARTMREQHIHRVLVVEDHALVGVITSFVGAYLSYFLDGATGGVIVTLQTVLFLAAFFFAPKHGLIAARRRRLAGAELAA